MQLSNYFACAEPDCTNICKQMMWTAVSRQGMGLVNLTRSEAFFTEIIRAPLKNDCFFVQLVPPLVFPSAAPSF